MECLEDTSCLSDLSRVSISSSSHWKHSSVIVGRLDPKLFPYKYHVLKVFMIKQNMKKAEVKVAQRKVEKLHHSFLMDRLNLFPFICLLHQDWSSAFRTARVPYVIPYLLETSKSFWCIVLGKYFQNSPIWMFLNPNKKLCCSCYCLLKYSYIYVEVRIL